MALQCQVTLNYSSYSSGQTPPPQATLFVYNPNAVPVTVTGLQLSFRALNDVSINRTTALPSVPPIGPGMTVTAPAGASISIGPFPVVVASGANVNSFQAINQTGNLNPINPQGSQPAQFTVMVGGLVYGSDGSVNTIGEAAILVSYESPPPVAYQGGFLQYASPNNFVSLMLMGVL